MKNKQNPIKIERLKFEPIKNNEDHPTLKGFQIVKFEVDFYVKKLTKSTKREWIEDKTDCRLVLWDTDLEPEEQYCVDYMLEFFNYEQGSFELEELREILAENTDEENLVMTCNTLINSLIRHGKETIETE